MKVILWSIFISTFCTTATFAAKNEAPFFCTKIMGPLSGIKFSPFIYNFVEGQNYCEGFTNPRITYELYRFSKTKNQSIALAHLSFNSIGEQEIQSQHSMEISLPPIEQNTNIRIVSVFDFGFYRVDGTIPQKESIFIWNMVQINKLDMYSGFSNKKLLGVTAFFLTENETRIYRPALINSKESVGAGKAAVEMVIRPIVDARKPILQWLAFDQSAGCTDPITSPINADEFTKQNLIFPSQAPIRLSNVPLPKTDQKIVCLKVSFETQSRFPDQPPSQIEGLFPIEIDHQF